MASPYIGEIRIFGGNFAINGWAFCNGALMPISENDALFQLIGTTFGGDGQSTFGLPNLQSRVPLGQGQGPGLSNRVLGEAGGTETTTLAVQQIPSHSHLPLCSSAAGNSASAAGRFWATSANTGVQPYSTTTAGVAAMKAATIGSTGGSQPHDNMIPFLAVTFIISLFGVFPSQ